VHRPFVQMIYRLTLNQSSEVIAAHQTKPLPIVLENWLEVGIIPIVSFDSPKCVSFSSEGALRRLAAKYGANHIQNVCAETQETASQ
jgi:hypothetical protein